MKRALLAAWNATAPLENIPHEQVQLLSRNKYVTDEWNLKF